VDIDIHQGARFKAKSGSAFFSQRSGLATDFSKTTSRVLASLIVYGRVEP